MELHLQVSNIFMCDIQRNMNEVSIEEDDERERVTAIDTRVDHDDGAPTGCALEIGKERGKKEMGKTRLLANIGHNILQFEVEVEHPFVLICTR